MKIGNQKLILTIVSGDDESLPICIMINIIAKSERINPIFIGNVENHIDPFFDIDFQRYINKLSKKIKGKTSFLMFS